MSAISHEGSKPQRIRRVNELVVRDTWVGLSIGVIWLAVLFAAVFGPDIVTVDAGGGSSRVPSAVAVALFAAIATWMVAKYGFGSRDRDAD
jgi:Mg/Co/Ni transporter MgtE